MIRRIVIILLPLLPILAFAQDRKPEPKDRPQIIGTAPLAIVPGVPTKLTIRGLKLNDATDVHLGESKAKVKILSKGTAAVPNQVPATLVGDTQVQVEVNLPADMPTSPIPLVVVTPTGASAPHTLLVDAKDTVLAEKESNNGFEQAQPLELGKALQGTIGQPQDVDVFRFDAPAKQRLVIELTARKRGSPLDSILMLFDRDGKILAINDDHDGQADSRLEVVLPGGTYYLSVMDAHDQGGPYYAYRLTVIRAK